LKDYGVEYIYFRPVIDHKELAVDTNLNYLKKYETDTFSILTDAMEENKITGNGGVPCVAHSVTTVVTADGGVYLCGRLNKYDWWEPIGNLYRDNFHSIWTSEKRKMQSKLVSDPSFCLKHCPECRITKYNLLFKRTGQVKTIDFI
jgi:radical SAM protein with 4Fe4S-binding SPASM domain